MKEFLFLIKTEGDYCAALTQEQYQDHLKKVSNYIHRLMEEGKLKEAQPLQMGGLVIHGNRGIFKDGPFVESKEVIVGYYQILANDINEAVEIAKANPVFEDTEAWMEIRAVKHEDGIN
jgi:hypothetical protein